MARLVTAEDTEKAANADEIEYQVRHSGGMLEFFNSFAKAKQYAEECDERFDTLSWREPKRGIRIRIQCNYLPPIFFPHFVHSLNVCVSETQSFGLGMVT
jgi:hypothetical protein